MRAARPFWRPLPAKKGQRVTLRLGFAYVDGSAGCDSSSRTVENGTALIHKLAHDDRHMSLSPGTLLSAAMFQHVIDIDQVTEIDCGTGRDAYKKQWMEGVRPRFRIDLLWPTHMANWPVIARSHLRQIRRWAA